jgi:hypothetical protein
MSKSQGTSARWNLLLSFFFDSKLLSRVLEHRLGPPRSIDRGADFANDVVSGGPDTGDLVLLVHLSLNHVATEVHVSKFGDRQSGFAYVRREVTAGASSHWLRVPAKATPPTREGLALGGDKRPALCGFLLGPPRELPGVLNGILAP